MHPRYIDARHQVRIEAPRAAAEIRLRSRELARQEERERRRIEHRPEQERPRWVIARVRGRRAARTRPVSA
jgi:hypothetical protein